MQKLIDTLTLHSTMFLLIQDSIQKVTSGKETLHSTMFLLIQRNKLESSVDFLFTFHNVSINTKYAEGTLQSGKVFTFHNVSINTVE